MKTMKILIAIILTLQMACKKDNDNGQSTESLVGKWELASVKNKISDQVVSYPDTLDRKIRLHFMDSSKVLLQGYCNSGEANYSVNNKSLSFKDISMTELICFGDGGLWESYLNRLWYVNTFTIDGHELKLLTESDIDLYLQKLED